jgi:hypothetical protein
MSSIQLSKFCRSVLSHSYQSFSYGTQTLLWHTLLVCYTHFGLFRTNKVQQPFVEADIYYPECNVEVYS